MIDKIIKWILINSYSILVYLFWIYFLVFVFTYRFLPVIFDYLLFLFGGLYLGYKICLLTLDYLNKKKISPFGVVYRKKDK